MWVIYQLKVDYVIQEKKMHRAKVAEFERKVSDLIYALHTLLKNKTI